MYNSCTSIKCAHMCQVPVNISQHIRKIANTHAAPVTKTNVIPPSRTLMSTLFRDCSGNVSKCLGKRGVDYGFLFLLVMHIVLP